MKERIKESFSAGKPIPRFLASWCFVQVLLLLSDEDAFDNVAYAFSVSPIRYAVSVLGLFAAFSLVNCMVRRLQTDAWLLTGGFFLCAVGYLSKKRDMWFCITLLLLACALLCYLLKDDKLGLQKTKWNKRATVVVTAVAGAVVLGLIGTFTCMRQAAYCTPNYDFGLFCNMFYYMRKTLLPLVSSERDMILSHFAVHISPIYYVLLPFYALFPSPYTLQIGQAVVLASGVLPVYFLAKHKNLSPKLTAVLMVAYALNPVIFCGTSYDLHENCFLVPLLLWMFCFFEKKKYIPMFVFALLTCMVKEDATLFVLFFGLFLIFSRKEYRCGITLSVFSLAWFGAALLLLSKYGDGVMSNHFENYMYEDNGLVGMIRVILMDPGYAVGQIMTQDKFLFLLKMLLPLGFLPICSRRVSQLLLLFPFILENLMTSYVYQYSIDFQYCFGAAACMIYLAVLNASELKARTARYLCLLAADSSLFLFTVNAWPKLNSTATKYFNYQAEFEALDEALSHVPDGASVKASTFLVPHLYARDEIYDIKSDNETDYVVFDMRGIYAEDTVALRAKYVLQGYTVCYDSPGSILILQNPSLAANQQGGK
ncbi:MAG TPA: hypothetical protein DDY98_04535 [Ruminococcaceae bacterium]|nr:hypothetical protein [Oscillospiraceae bacterium]